VYLIGSQPARYLDVDGDQHHRLHDQRTGEAVGTISDSRRKEKVDLVWSGLLSIYLTWSDVM
jgi:hypothetical protein